MRALALSLAVALAACGGEPEPEAPAAMPELSALLTLGEGGVGRLDGSVPFDTAAVRAALPGGFTVELRSAETDAGLVPVAWALRDGQLVLEVFGDGGRVARVDAVSAEVDGPDGRHVGQTFAEANGAAMDCEPGTAELGGRAVCRPNRGAPIRYVFASRFATPGGPLPPADSLADAFLERLVWLAD